MMLFDIESNYHLSMCAVNMLKRRVFDANCLIDAAETKHFSQSYFGGFH
jgi:hypothetical protein